MIFLPRHPQPLLLAVEMHEEARLLLEAGVVVVQPPPMQQAVEQQRSHPDQVL
jgi:hypothetical protein